VKRCLPCSHSFHSDCLVGWFLQGKVICPYCRRRFGQESSDSESLTSSGDGELPIDTREAPYWTTVSRNSDREVVQWVFSKIKTLSRRAMAPAALKRRFDLKLKYENAVKTAKRAVCDFSTVQGTWKVLRKKRRRLLTAWRLSMKANVQTMYATLKVCQDTPSVRKFLIESDRPIPRPPWWR